MSISHFSATELTELEALEIMGGATANPLSQEECYNGAEHCGWDVSQKRCSNSIRLCGTRPPIMTQAGCVCSQTGCNCEIVRPED